MKNDATAVLDLGTSKVVCLVGSLDPCGDIEVLAAGVASCSGVKRGVVTDLDATSAAIDTAVRQAQQQLGADIPKLSVGLAGNRVEGIAAQGFVPIYPRSRQITREDVLQVINHSRQVGLPPDREQVQVLPKEFRVDGVRDVRKPIGMSGSRLEATSYIVTAETAYLLNIEKALGMAGKKVDQMALSSLCAGLAVLSQEELDNNAVVVDIGAGTTDVAVFVNGLIAYSAGLPIGGQHVTSDVGKLLKTSPDEAERLKVSYGSATSKGMSEAESVDVMQIGQMQPRPLHRKVLCEIIESRMRELALMVRQHLEKSGAYGSLPGGVALTGGASLLPGTDKLFEETLKHLRVRTASPPVESPDRRIASQPGLATAYGMLRFILQCGENELSPASANGSWKDRVKSMISLLGGKA